MNGWSRAPRDQTVVVSKHPLQLLLVELLQRPIEFTQHLAIWYTDRLADAGIGYVPPAEYEAQYYQQAAAA